jgi:hypothetical protein
MWDKLLGQLARSQALFTRCQACRADQISGFIIDSFPELEPVEAMKFGELYKCTKCYNYWFLDDDKIWLSRIKDELLPLVHQWSRETSALDAAILSALVEIGGAQSRGGGDIDIPCSAKNTLGQQFETAMVVITKQPPLYHTKIPLYRASELASVTPSPFALPLDVRQASAAKEEVSMGFAPTGIIDTRGQEYTLCQQSDFFQKNGVSGEQIKLSGRQKQFKNVVWRESVPVQARFYVDWFEGCERLADRDG